MPLSKQRFSILALLVLLMCAALTARANIFASYFSVQDGLNGRLVMKTVQDSRGFLWIGTQQGLNRFDGRRFRSYTTAATGERIGSVGRMIEGPDELLWVVGLHQLFVLDLRTDSLHSVEHYYGLEPAPDLVWTSLAGSTEGIYVFGNGGRMLRVLPGKEPDFVALMPFDEPIANQHGNCAMQFRDGGFAIMLRNEHTVLLHPDGSPLATIQAPQPATPLGKLPDGRYAFLCYAQGEETDIRNNTFAWGMESGWSPLLHDVFADSVSIKYCHYEPETQQFYFSGRQAFFQCDWQATQAVDLTAEVQLPAEQFDFWVDCALTPNSWCVIHADGFSILTQRKHRFSNFLDASTVVDNDDWPTSLRMISVDDNTLYARLWQFSVSQDLTTPNAQPRIIAAEDFRQWGEGNRQRAWLANKQGELKFLGNHLWRWQVNASGDSVLWMSEMLKGDLDYSTRPGQAISVFDLSPYADEAGLIIVNALIADRKGHLWVCTSNGLLHFQPNGAVVHHHSGAGPNGSAWPFGSIFHACQDEAGVFWLATSGQGLLRWNPQSNAVKQYSMREGLSCDVLHSVYEDAQHHLWMSSNNGLMRFDPSTATTQVFLERDGIAHDEFNKFSHLRTPDGRLCFGGLNGVTTFYPSDFFHATTTTSAPFTVISCRQLDAASGKLVDHTAALRESGSIAMSPSDRALHLELALLEFDAPGRQQYQFRIAGLYDDWQPAEAATVRINGLPYGDFTLSLRAVNAQGQHSSVIDLPLHVARPIWQQPWMYVLAALFIAGAVLWRIQQLKKAKARVEQLVEDRTAQIQRDKETIEAQAKELQRLDEARSRFFANVSHELRTPLTIMLGLADKLHQLAQLTSEERDMLDVLNRNGRQLEQYINELLDLTRLDSGELKVVERPVSLKDFLSQRAAAFEALAHNNQQRFTSRLDVAPGQTVLLDANKCTIIINNLLSNALKFTPAEGEIHLEASYRNRTLMLTVSDTGPGIPAADREKIFDRFYQAQAHAINAAGGMGIGLAVSKEYAVAMGGSLELEPANGPGCTFSVLLPAQETSPVAEDLPPPQHVTHASAVLSQPTEEDAERPVVLVVEDNTDMLAYLRLVLANRYNVLAAANGKLALQQLETHGERVHLILSDVMMPEMDGFALLKAVKANPTWSQLPFIILTARVGLEDKLQALRIGVDDYLHKPFAEAELLARLDNLSTYKHQRNEPADEEPTPATPGLRAVEQDWLANLEQLVRNGIGEEHFNVLWLADRLHISERQLRRKLKALTGLTPNKYILEVRLQAGRELIESGRYVTLKEICGQIGIGTTWYFSNEFEKRFGTRPGAMLETEYSTS